MPENERKNNDRIRTEKQMEVKCDALMLRANDYKDNDKLLTLFAADFIGQNNLLHGTVTAVSPEGLSLLPPPPFSPPCKRR